MKQLQHIEDPNTYGIFVCADCHSTIHKKIEHVALALEYNTTELLLAHPEIARFVQWASKQQKHIKRK